MKHFYKFSIFLLIMLTVVCRSSSYAGIGDTTVVQTFRYDTNMRAGVFIFPDDTTKTYQKIVMLYSMRCKNGLVSTSSNTNLGCGEWDYNCYTYMVDSTQTDSLSSFTNSYRISNFSDTVFNYTTVPVWTYTQYNQLAVTYTSIISEDSAIVGAGTTSLNDPLSTSNVSGRTQYLWTAAELSAAGLTAGDITGLRMDVSGTGSAIENLRIKIKHSSATILDENNPDVSGYSEVYFLSTTISTTGIQSFNFHTPFTWDGTSNLMVDFSYTNASTGLDNAVQGEDAGFDAGLVSTQPDAYLNVNGSLSFVKMNPSFFPSITDKITIAFWAYGDPAKLPANTSIIEGNDNSNNRQVNIHFPWSDSNIYFDCGNDGTGYDRIQKLATTTEFEGQWNFWAFTKNATTGDMKIYLNGALWMSGTGKTRMINIKNMVAGMGIGGTNFYYGSYDELSIWNTDLGLTSIQQIMNKDITNAHPDYANLLAYYKLNEGTANTATDSSPNAFDSEIINPAWRNHHGNDVFRNFNVTTFRPNTTFVSGVYTTSVQNFTVLDSVLNNATSVISYNVTNNSLTAIDTNYVWPSGYAYVYDTSGTKIDSIAIVAEDTLHLTQLHYYQKRPMRMELINFITPYGIGLNLGGLIGKTWEFDVTDYAPLLKGAHYMAMDDAGKLSEDNDIKFVFYEGTPPRNVVSVSQIWPNGNWVSPSYADIASNKYFEPRDIVLAPNTSQYKIRSAISGHQQNGEFDPHTHTITLNGITSFTRNLTKECATNPIYPQGGTWVYDRQGWCPGAAVDMVDYEITSNVTPGSTINLDYSIPQAVAGSSNYRINNQLVSYDVPNFTLDAAVDYVKRPSNRVEFLRLNPICNAPIVAIKNTGSTVLTSLDITYGRVGGVMSSYHWTGSLNFLSTTEVTLPAPNWLGTNVNEFIAVVSNPNSGVDGYGGNDTMVSAFDIPVSYPAGLIFELRTNNYGSQTSYTLKDASGTNVISKFNLGNNIIYRDTVYLNTDCYTVQLTDGGDDGLQWWANTAQGTGYFRIKNASTGAILKTFNADFGDNIYQQFTVNYSLPVEELSSAPVEDLTVYPNPAGDAFTASFSMPAKSNATVMLMNVLGEVLQSENVTVTQPVEKFIMDVSNIENGIYYVVVQSGNYHKTQKLVITR